MGRATEQRSGHNRGLLFSITADEAEEPKVGVENGSGERHLAKEDKAMRSPSLMAAEV